MHVSAFRILIGAPLNFAILLGAPLNFAILLGVSLNFTECLSVRDAAIYIAKPILKCLPPPLGDVIR